MSDERTELLQEANELGLEFPSNVKTEKLRIMVAESQGPAIKEPESEEPVSEEPEDETGIPNSATATSGVLSEPAGKNVQPGSPVAKSAFTLKREKIQKAKLRATKTHIVTITNKDNRENDVMTTVPLSFENEHFGLSRNVPLDIPVEIEQALIDIAESTMMTLHKDEIIQGKRTGNKIAVSVKKFAISYGKPIE